MKNKLTALKLPKLKLNRTIVLVSAAILIILLTLAYGAVRNTQANKVQAEHDQAVAARILAHDRAREDRIVALSSQLKASQEQKTAVCSYVASLAAQKALVKLVSVPAQCK